MTTPPHDPGRRSFLRQAAVTGLSAAGLGAASWALFDNKPPSALEDESLFVLPDFRVPGIDPKPAVVQGAHRAETVRRAIEQLGGISRFIRRGDRVLLKVNAAFASAPLIGATTHPDLVTAVARMCFDAGAADVRVTDNPINDPDSCFRLSGIARAAEAGGASLWLPRPAYFRPVTLESARHIVRWPVLADPFKGITKLIGLAPVKDHHRSGASMTLKNWYGLLGGRRNLFHQDVHGLIAEMARWVRPTLVILDGTVSMVSNGPTGGSPDDLRETGTMIVGTDPVAVDTAGAALLGRSPGDLPFLLLSRNAVAQFLNGPRAASEERS